MKISKQVAYDFYTTLAITAALLIAGWIMLNADKIEAFIKTIRK